MNKLISEFRGNGEKGVKNPLKSIGVRYHYKWEEENYNST